mgnify:CR=1 FL=1
MQRYELQSRFQTFDPGKAEIIYDDRSLTIETIPLRHRIQHADSSFQKNRPPPIFVDDMIDFYEIPVYELNRIKNGADYTLPDGKIVPNNKLTIPSALPRRYAYCSDTIYLPRIIEQIYGVDLLFHEATFAQSEQARAKETFHTTASQAGEIARTAKVKQLLIGHFSARYEDESILLQEASDIFPNTLLARETLKISIESIKP